MFILTENQLSAYTHIFPLKTSRKIKIPRQTQNMASRQSSLNKIYDQWGSQFLWKGILSRRISVEKQACFYNIQQKSMNDQNLSQFEEMEDQEELEEDHTPERVQIFKNGVSHKNRLEVQCSTNEVQGLKIKNHIPQVNGNQIMKVTEIHIAGKIIKVIDTIEVFSQQQKQPHQQSNSSSSSGGQKNISITGSDSKNSGDQELGEIG